LRRKLGLEGIVSKEARRAVQVRAIKGVAENQKSESGGGNSGHRWDILDALENLADVI
jgi:hypothetical protein